MGALRSALGLLRTTLDSLSDRFEFDPRGLVPAALLVVSIVLLIAKLSTSPNLFVGKQTIHVRGRVQQPPCRQGHLFIGNHNFRKTNLLRIGGVGTPRITSIIVERVPPNSKCGH